MSVASSKWVVGLRGVPHPARVLLFVLADHADHNHKSWPSMELLTEETGLKRSQLYHWISYCVKFQLVQFDGKSFQLPVRKSGQIRPEIRTKSSGKPDSPVRKTGQNCPENRILPSGKPDSPISVEPISNEPSLNRKDIAKSKTTSPTNPSPRPRDEMFDAICEISGVDPSVGHNGGRVGKLKAMLLAAKPPYTVAEVREFGAIWKREHPYNQHPSWQQFESQVGIVRNRARKQQHRQDPRQAPAGFLPDPAEPVDF